MLVGFIEGDTEPSAGTTIEQIQIGRSSIIPVPDLGMGVDRYLYLGFHDGVQWNNNTGWAMFVEVEDL